MLELHIKEVFQFEDGSTVFCGPYTGSENVTFPLEVTLQINGVDSQTLILSGERQKGNLPDNYKVLYSEKKVEIGDRYINNDCVLLNSASGNIIDDH